MRPNDFWTLSKLRPGDRYDEETIECFCDTG